MSRKILFALLVLIVAVPLVLLLAGQYLFTSVSDVDSAEQAAQESGAAAEEAVAVVEEFYRWYLAYPGNPYAERAYQESPLVTADFVAETDAAIDAMQAAGPGGADLILCAQDIPGEMRYGPGEVSGDTATVVVQQVWNPGTEFESIRELTVELQQVDGEWRISAVPCPVP